MIEGNSSVVIAWIQPSAAKGVVPYPLQQDISHLFEGVVLLAIRYIYHEENSVADWVIFFVA